MSGLRYRTRRLTLRDGRAVTLRAVRETDVPEILQAFDRLSPDSRYARFRHHKKNLNLDMVHRRVRPAAGHEFVFVATAPSTDGTDIVGAAQYLNSAAEDSDGRAADISRAAGSDAGDASDAIDAIDANHREDRRTCEFAITVADDWRGSGLAKALLGSLVRRARHDGYDVIEGFVLAENRPMLALARSARFTVVPMPGESDVVRVWRALRPGHGPGVVTVPPVHGTLDLPEN